ncbi:glycosyltransferase family 90 protein [Dothidotthia symphoricarpi CBS 119687]|uniref:Glycosyltransferase family 90 protein n=1 Tax=Dothidotthia symphoricarpi CBS 119687 TaxID=1392245 RepID=A0A6A6AV70_9PLEO|nr:glycosyltransferase family 90 protein [Dothidotthia symphoricarpi CBS 119687]KAF2134855.1 glycosyltransferase family 90 protein [Dothidotthia symphoricarpi CBS 119687]
MTTNHAGGTANDRMEAWLELTRSIADYLPDVDMAINVMDESRVVVPWEDIDGFVRKESESRRVMDEYRVQHRLPTLNISAEQSEQPTKVEWIGPGERFWDIARVGCSPQSPARQVIAVTNFTGPPPMPSGFPEGSFEGYVQNWTMVRDPCQQPTLQESHGTFVEPVSISTTRSLVPIFGESKLSMNNDILIPPAAYVSDGFSGGLYADTRGHGGEWIDKIAGAVWRGVASGGRNREENWTRFHRHRFVSMMNGTSVETAETNSDTDDRAPNFNLPNHRAYHLIATKAQNLGTWLNRLTNVGFTNLLCFPLTKAPTCNYTDPYFTLAPNIDMASLYDYKLLPDIDGNSFSGRYLAFLRSTSVPVKATIYSEWHDDRLIPWLHFIPMDNSFVDVYGIMDYFLGTAMGSKTLDSGALGAGARDGEARRIAVQGKEWAEKVLRREDMQIYMLRLLLEYARLCADEREQSGFVGDRVERPVLQGLAGEKGVNWRI